MLYEEELDMLTISAKLQDWKNFNHFERYTDFELLNQHVIELIVPEPQPDEEQFDATSGANNLSRD